MWHAIRSIFGGGDGARQRRRSTLDGANRDWFECHGLPFVEPPPMSGDSLSVASNPSVSSYNSSVRQRQHKYIAMQYFGPSSQTQFDFDDSDKHDRSPAGASTGSPYGDLNDTLADDAHPSADLATVLREETAAQRQLRKENERIFENLVHLANTKQPVSLSTFKCKPSSCDHVDEQGRRVVNVSAVNEDEDEEFSVPIDKQLNTQLIEAYVAYAKSIGREPEIEVAIGEPQSDDEEEALATERLSFVHERGRVDANEHWGTQWIGTRFSKRRGCVQFWCFLLVGVVVTAVMIIFLAQVRLNEVLHLDAFVGENVVLTDDFAFMHLRDEVGFRLKYDIDAGGREIQVLLLTEDNFEQFVDGENFTVVELASRWRTPYASLPLTRIENNAHDEMYLVVQPCELSLNNASIDMCAHDASIDGVGQLPTRVSSKEKLFALPKASEVSTNAQDGVNLMLRSFYVNPMPDTCSASGWKGVPFLLIFMPYLLASLFGLRVFQMLARCESFRSNLERNYKNEFVVPESEVDYWQPSPWDRKVPKTRLLGPCCWQKMRRPTEPFYTWWRHENYFTWIFFPYRNEQLSRGERGIIIFCSLYITFYVTFLLSMFHNVLGDNLPSVAGIVIYWFLLMLLPTLGKAIFKEIFKLIFRQRRKFFRLKAAGGDTSGFSFRLAFFMQLLVVVFITLAQGPMIYIWLYRSCAFLGEFMYFGVLAAVARLSILGLFMDFIWYTVIRAFGWRDLCPHCTERLATCDCFNDELLVLAVERVGAKWELILLLDNVLSRHAGHEPQFTQYSAKQLADRWHTLVDRAETHMQKVEKLHAYRLKKKRDAMRRRHTSRLSQFVERASFRSRGEAASNRPARTKDESEDPTCDETTDLLGDVDSMRERKILALDRKLRTGTFHTQSRTTIANVFQSIQRAVHGTTQGENTTDTSGTHATNHESSMRVMFATPAQRLTRREDEREQRERAFSVLAGYRIEKKHRTTQGQVLEENELARKPASLFGRWWQSLRGGELRSTRELLIPSSVADATIAGTDAREVVVVVREDPALTTLDEGEEDTNGRSFVGPAATHGDSESPMRTETYYEVTPRDLTLWDTAVGRFSSLVGWMFKYDSNQY